MGFLQHYYVKVSADYSDPPPMHPHAADLPGIAVSEKAHFGGFCPFTGRTGRRSFFATLGQLACAEALAGAAPGPCNQLKDWSLRAIADAAGPCLGQPARRSFPTEQETAPYETVCERPTAHELQRVYTSVESTGVADRDSRRDDEHRFSWAG